MKIRLLFLILQFFSYSNAQELYPYRKDTLWGFCDSIKQIKIKPEYDYVSPFYSGVKSAIVAKNKKYGVIDNKAILKIPMIFDYIKYFNSNYYTNINGLIGLMDSNINSLLTNYYSSILEMDNGCFFTQRYIVNKKDINVEKRHLINHSDNKIVYKLSDSSIIISVPLKKFIVEKQNYIFNEYESYTLYTDEDINLKKINCYISKSNIKDTAYEINENLFAKISEIFNSKGDLLVSDSSNSLNYIGSNRFKRYNYKEQKFEILNNKFECLNLIDYSGYIYDYYDNYLKFYNNCKTYIYDTNVVLKCLFNGEVSQNSVSGNRFWGRSSYFSKWGYYDFNKNLIIDSVYDKVHSCSNENSYFVVSKNKKYGMIDANNKIIIPFQYSYLSSFVNNLAEACDNDSSCGFINIKNERIIPFKYILNYTFFNEGLAEVKLRKNNVFYYGFINLKNEEVIPINFFTEYDINYIENGIGELREFSNNYKSKFYFHKNGCLFFD